MKTGFLPKVTEPQQSSNGFTLIPNHILDGLLNDDGPGKISDNVALATFLLRHVPGQHASVLLAFQFSQKAICESLGWGKTNIKRFKRALSSLERIGLLTVHLQNNNLLALRIDARLRENSKSKENNSSESQEEISGGGDEETSHLLINNIKQNINKKTHHQTESHSHPFQDEDVKEIFDFYQEEFSLPIPIRHKQTFIEEFQAGGKQKSLVIQRLKSMATHPFLRKEVKSINAVWHFGFLFSKSLSFEKSARAVISQLGENPRPQDLANFKQSIESQGYDFELFTRYFALTISKVA